jgi:hypothetical protein
MLPLPIACGYESDIASDGIRFEPEQRRQVIRPAAGSASARLAIR